MGAIEQYKARNAAREARRAEKEKSPEKRRWWFNQPVPIDRFTGWLVAWTALLFAATVFNVVVINHTDEKIGGQLEEMKRAYGPLKDSADAAKAAIVAGQRAWIRIDSISIRGAGLRVSAEGIDAPIAFVVTNVGNAPALNVWFHAKLVSMGVSLGEEQIKACEENRNSPMIFGHTLFPNEQLPQSLGYGEYISNTNIPKESVARYLLPGPDKIVSLYVIGCVSYAFPTDPTGFHQTPFIRIVMLNEARFIHIDDGLIPPSRLLLRESGIFQGRAAD